MSIKSNALAFWKYFLKNQKEIESALESQDKDKIKFWNDKLGDECLKVAGCYLSIEREDDFNLLTFEPMRDKTSQIICVYLKKFAPKALVDSWIIFDCIPPLCDKINHYRFNIDEKDYTIHDIEIGFIETPKVKDSFSVSLVCEAFENMNDNEKDIIGETYVQNVLGDLVLNSYVEKIECSPVKKDFVKYVPMAEGYDEIIDFMELHNYKPYSDCTQIYTVYKLDEENTSDEILDDRILISTIHPMNFIEVMNNERRSLNQITRLQGEVGFLVLSIDEFNESVAEQKRVLEKELNDLLYELGIARVTGSGIAPKRVYFEMFIFDKEEFKKAVVKVVSKLNLPITYLAY